MTRPPFSGAWALEQAELAHHFLQIVVREIAPKKGGPIRYEKCVPRHSLRAAELGPWLAVALQGLWM